MSARSNLALIMLMAMVSGAVVIAGLVLTTPRQLGPSYVTLWFVGLWVALAGALTIGGYFGRTLVNHQIIRGEALSASLRQGLLIAGLLVVWLALSSLRMLDLKDIVLLTLIAMILNFYFGFKKR